jgi:hypothetical protein
MLVDKVLEDDGLHAADGGFTLQIRLPWYRSLPLSAVEIESLSIDGQPQRAEDILFCLERDQWDLSELPNLTDRYWFVLDSAELRVKAAPLAFGTNHVVEVQVALYPPYVRGLKRIFRCAKAMRLD